MQSDSSKFEISGILTLADDGSFAGHSDPQDASGPCVYMAHGFGDELLYVGVTNDLITRLQRHRQNWAAWLTYTKHIRWETYPTRAAAEAAEKRYIRSLGPKYNVAHQRRQNALEPHYSDAQWRSLGTHIRERRTFLRRSQTSIARDADIAVTVLRQLEAGQLTKLPAEAGQIERALGWRSNSMRFVLSGGVAEYLTAEERRQQAVDAYDTVWSRA